MSTTVSYHRDGYAAGRPAIDVKDHHAGMDYRIALERLVGPLAETALDDDRDDSLRSIAYDRITSDFWQAAQEIATQRGLGEITQEGRSGGWLVLTAGYDPEEDYPDGDGDDDLANSANRQEVWLAAYAALRDWCEAYIAAAPARVAALAQQLAMDEIGYPAARRMFGEGFA